MKTGPIKIRYLVCFILFLGSLFPVLYASAEQSSVAEPPVELDPVVITGSHIAVRESDIASPIEVIGRESIEASGAATLNDFVKNIVSNIGAEFNADPFSQTTSGGTSQINLRGLGLSSTLTLLNGRRTSLGGGYANDGSTFVDINAIPLIAVERIEIVKDGASALYGSDAVAGVVDFITRNDFEGIEITTGYQTTTEGSQEDKDISLLWGWQGDKLKTTLALSYFDRQALAATERDFTEGTGESILGNPGAFIPLGAIDPGSPYAGLNGLAPAGTPIRDPGCEAGGGIIAEGANDFFGTCDMNFIPFYNLVPEEDRLQSFFNMEYALSHNWSVFAEAGYSETNQTFTASPSFPLLTFPVIPATNVGNLPANGGYGTPLVFLGRASGNGAEASESERESTSTRFLLGINNQINQNWQWESAYHYSASYYYLGGPDTLIDRFDAALNGVGGPNNNEYFNPFATALTVPALANNQAVIDDFTAISYRKVDTSLQTWDAIITGSLFELPAGKVESAFGIQYRYETNRQRLDANSRAFNYAFVVGSENSSDSRDIYALFSEFMLPLADTVNVQLAGRFEDYGGDTGSSFDPKIGIRWNPNETWSLRSSVSTAFRAPSLHQTSSFTIAAEQLEGSFVPVVTEGSTDLKPEEAVIFNAGTIFKPSKEMRVSLDYWRYDYEDIIVKESAEGILAANPNDPRIIRDPTTNSITRVNLDFINASSVVTDGIDLILDYRLPTEVGVFGLNSNSTYINSYELKEHAGGETIDAVGQRNELNIARPLPPLRSNLSLSWLYANHELSTTSRYTDSYEDDANDASVDHHLTQDIQYRYFLPMLKMIESNIAIGAINVFNNDPPAVEDNFGYDSKMHDPRGRMVYGRLTVQF
jgi:iron complex outermembrane receptor protein